ncbi:MAG: S41 family peptidase [Henriciella sp.]|uniref:S41 family peptidase n=1 Tax=Henriciella sp. TaxID=1968823 RepID=UPI003C710A4D
MADSGGNAAAEVAETRTEIEQDVLAFCELVRARYAYIDSRREVWDETCDMAREEAQLAKAQTPSGHLALLERMVDQLHDNHVSLNTNSAVSPRLVPSGSDVWLSLDGGVAKVHAVRPLSGASVAGLKVGDAVTHLNGVPVLAAATARILAARGTVTSQRLDWAINAQAAGYRGAPRIASVLRDGEIIELDLGVPEPAAPPHKVSWRRLPGNIGYIRIEDSLGDEATIEAFDDALAELKDARRWVIDLRNTPGGGNTGVAEPIMGRFIRGVKPYQRSGPRWHGQPVRYVASRGPWRARGKVAVLVGRWTGSMGEGMAVGFDGLRRARVFGSDMAGLAGGVEGFNLPGSGIGVRFPTYDLLHIKGQSRHEWSPPYRVIADNGDGPDLALEAALEWLRR